jgi:toxin HigB-1
MRNITHYTDNMIRTFRHAGLEKFFKTGSKAGIQPAHAKKLRVLLTNLDEAEKPQDMDFIAWDLHELRGDLAGHWSVKVNGNWRVTFRFDGEDAILVDYQDYH